MRAQGQTPKFIAHALNIQVSYVYTILREAGHPASGRHSKRLDRINIRLDTDCIEKVRKYSHKHGKSITTAINDCIRVAQLGE